ncbi:4Fe-4S dicluster domain-containing protein [Thermopetrobacter sp. TC1]|uniref:4Fe-4S dicluster domain-containing protein n=1 Tax=Thermopetrobacter sp. TC1 TaxID=1495045 RepID=UPI00056EF366|nr:4Fe-4S dicluster domain-containing protein [Thermopetrobacter sp. TC1]
MEMALVIDPDKCTGCRQCELACSSRHTGAYNPARSRIVVFDFQEERGKFVPYTCTQCDQAWCQQVCPVEAITNENGVKVVNEAICVGCKVCTIACPFGTINYDPASGKVIKCDLCGGDPACAAACPTDAIVYTDIAVQGYEKMREWAAKTDTAPQASA